MRVAITGGTGFVGSHTVDRLIADGHRPRLLVRDPTKVGRVLGPLGVEAGQIEVVVGDMGDPGAVADLLDGAEAVIHAAAAVGVTGPRSDVLAQNVGGARNVIGAALARGIDPIVHVSSVAVFVPPDGPVITAESRLASPRTDYGRSKVEAERYVRDLQDGGAAITTVYPGGVLGPGQPTLDSFMEGLAGALSSVWPMPRAGVGVLHVRDLAEALVRAVEPGRGPRRLVLGGDFLTWPALADLCDELTGVRCRRMVVPTGVLIGLGSALDAAKRVRWFDYPLTRDAGEVMATMVPTDDRSALEELGITLRPVRDTLEEALRVLAAAGHLRPDRAGRLGPEATVDADQEQAPGTVRTFPDRGVRGLLARRVVAPLATSSAFVRVGPKVVPHLDRTVHRLTGGRVVMSAAMVPTLILTTTGRRSGEPREVPLACVPETAGSWLVAGSNFGREHHPAWTDNLLADPRARVAFGRRRAVVEAELLEGPDREVVWDHLLRVWPLYTAYAERSGRDLRVFRLTPTT